MKSHTKIGTHRSSYNAADTAQERAFEVNIPLTIALILMSTIIASITTFFNNLEGDVVTFALAASTFFFAWAAILYMTSGENQRRIDYAKMSLYAALTGLALALMAGTIAGLVNSAAKGQ
jgi:small neutral amino acid transporter SnatA (MarC family)